MSPRVRCKSVENSKIARNLAEQSNSTELTSVTKAPPKPIFIVKPRNSRDNSVPIQYEVVEVNATARSTESSSDIDLTEHIKAKSESSTKASTGPKCNESRKQRKQDISKSAVTCFFSDYTANISGVEQINSSSGDHLENKNSSTQKSKHCSRVARKIVKKYIPISRNGIQLILKKLCRIVRCFEFHLNYTNNKYLLAVYNSIETFNIYLTLVKYYLKMANNVKRTSKDGGDELNRRSKLIDDIAVEHQDTNNPCSNPIVNVVTKKNPKAQRSDNTRLMLLRETKEDINEKDLGECSFDFVVDFHIDWAKSSTPGKL